MKRYGTYKFDKGLNTEINPQLMDVSEAQTLLNIDESTGSLSSINGHIFTGMTSPEDLGHWGNANRSWVKWYENYYWSINNPTGATYYGGNKITLGVEYPSAPPVITPVGSAGLTGDFLYCWTYRNEELWESAPGELDAWYTAITLADQKGSYKVPKMPTGITKVVVYRTLKSGNTFYYLNEHTADESGITYIDNASDAQIMLNEELTTINALPPPDGGKYLCERNGVFFVAVGSLLYFSDSGNPHSWNPLNWIGFDDTITGMGKEQYGILVFTSNRCYRVTGSDSISIQKQEIPGNQGCPNGRTIASLKNYPMWMSNDGICAWDGANLTLITNGKINIDFIPTHACSANDMYYLFHDGKALIFDQRNGGIFREIECNSDYAWYDPDLDKIYSLYNDGGGNKVYDLYQTTKLASIYRSPYIAGTINVLKTYRRAMVNSDCPITFKFYIDGVLKFTRSVIGTGRREVYFPGSLNGRYGELQLEFSGNIFEYEVEYQERINGTE